MPGCSVRRSSAAYGGLNNAAYVDTLISHTGVSFVTANVTRWSTV